MNNSPWFSTTRGSEAAELRLFCLPHAGGGTAAYHRWTHLLPESIQLVAIKLPGREDRFDEAPHENLDQLASEIAQEIQPLLDRPFAFFGHSMGAAVGYRIAVHLARNTFRLPTVLFVSACRSPISLRGDTPLHALEDQQMIEGLLSRYGSSTGDDPQQNGEMELMRLMANTIRADLKMLETYEHDNADKLDCEIYAFGGTEDPQVTRGELQRWHDMTAVKFSTRVFPGDHFYLRKQESAVVKTIVGRLQS